MCIIVGMVLYCFRVKESCLLDSHVCMCTCLQKGILAVVYSSIPVSSRKYRPQEWYARLNPSMVEILSIFILMYSLSLPPLVLCEDGLLVLQSLLEGMMLEVHITGWAATAHDKSALTVAQVEASQTAAAVAGEEGEDTPNSPPSQQDKTTLPMVELYTQFGSQVSCVYMYNCILYNIMCTKNITMILGNIIAYSY